MRVPQPVLPAKTLREEIVVVLFLSLLASAVYAIISYTQAPLKGVTIYSVRQVPFFTQLANFVFGLAPVWLVVYLVRRDGEGLGAIGLGTERLGQDVGRGVVLFALTGVAGIGIYLGAVALGVNRFVVPVPPLGHWWTVPVLLMTGYALSDLAGRAAAAGAADVLAKPFDAIELLTATRRALEASRTGEKERLR